MFLTKTSSMPGTFKYVVAGRLLHREGVKILRVMQLTAVLLLAAVLQVSATGSAQSVTYSGKGQPIAKVFSVIQEQTGYLFFYRDADLKNAKPVTVQLDNANIEDALKNVLDGQKLEYKIEGNTIRISAEKKEKRSVADQLNENAPPIGGVVRDANGKPLAGVNIVIKGTNKGTISSEYGGFSIDAKIGDKLVASSVGYHPAEFTVTSQETIFVQLQVNNSPLDEVQIIAYGTSTQRLNTGNVSVVKSEDIQKQPVANPLLAMAGRVPGVFVAQNSGVPGSGVNIQIRGKNSIGSLTNPLYIVDGVPYTSTLIPGAFGSGTGIGLGIIDAGNPLNFINVNDIEGISVLKDADATAIYGSRGANGVILITTKKGKAGQTRIDFDISQGSGQVPKKIDLLNTQQYLEMRREAFKNDNVIPTPENAVDLFSWDTTRYTDWQKELIGGTADYTNARVSASGGNTNTQYLLNAGYRRESTVFPGNFDDTKASLHFNLNNRSLNQKLRINFSASYMMDENTLPSTDLTAFTNLAPHAPDLLNPDGSLSWNSDLLNYGNPLAFLQQPYSAKTNNLISNLKFNYSILSGLDLSTSFGYTNMQNNEMQLLPRTSFSPSSGITTGRSRFSDNNISSWIIEPQLNYNKQIGNGKLDALIGTTFQQELRDGQTVSGFDYTSDALLENIAAAPRTTFNVVQSTYRYNAVFARLTYNLMDKYILNLNGRRDGSSRFGPANRFHNFGSAGAAWLFYKEQVINKLIPGLSFGKVRFSYGTTGNDQIGEYRFYDLYTPQTYAYNGIIGLYPQNLFNPVLAWEETKKFEAGLDVGFLQDKILFNASYYNNKSSNQLITYTLPGITGFIGIASNFPATVQNTGVELALTAKPITNTKFSWTSSINLSVQRNKLAAFPNIENTFYSYALEVGQPTTIQKLFKVAGVNDTTGAFEFYTAKDALTYNPDYLQDRTAIANPIPQFFGGWDNNFILGDFQFSFLVQFVKQTAYNPLVLSNAAGFPVNTYVNFLDRWQQPGDNAPMQRFTQDYSSQAFSSWTYYMNSSDFAYVDASFIRLKNVGVTYQFRKTFTDKLKMQNCSVYLQGQNLFTITNYKGLDPESAVNSLPPLRVITAGIRLSF